MTDTFNRLAWLRAIDPHLADAFRSAEVTAFDAPCAAYVALRGFAETFLDRDETSAGVPRGRPLYERIEAARAQKLIPADVLDGLDALRRDGNVAAHPAPEERKPERTVNDLLRVAWSCAAWLHRRRGGREDEVPTFQAPSLVDSAMVFRDAMMGGAMGTGDPVAKFHVAQSLIEHDERMQLRARKAGELIFLSRIPEALRLLQDVMHSVPAARALHARLTLSTTALGAEKIEEAISALQWGCEDNDPACMFELGVIHFHGLHGQPKDIEAARGLFERAASHEHPGAMHALAVVLCNGPADESGASARVLARRAAEAGELLGQANYGRMLIEGFGGEVDVVEGTMWLRRAARQNLAQAVWSLSAYLRDGKVIALGDEDADALLARACELGSTEALLHRADAALHNPDATADFAAALNDLVSSLAHAAVDDERAAVRRRLADALARLRRHVAALPDGEDRRAQCSLLANFGADGTPRRYEETCALLYEFAMAQVGKRQEASFDAWRFVLQTQWGVPDPTAADVARTKAKMMRGMEALRAAARRCGRNEPCPCASGLKAKRCHGR